MKITHSRTLRLPDAPNRWAWLPVPLLLAAMVLLRASGLRGGDESACLLAILNLILLTLPPFTVAFVAARRFLARPLPGMLLLGGGMVIWGFGNLVASVVEQDGSNLPVTIRSLCAWLAACALLAGAALLHRARRITSRAGWWTVGAYAAALGVVWLASRAALTNWLPTFFVPGLGGTTVRQFVIGSSISLLVLSASLLRQNKDDAHSASWYALGLVLMALGLFGQMLQSVAHSPLWWTIQAAQFVGSVYLVLAVLTSVSEQDVPNRALRSIPISTDQRYLGAIAIVIGAATVRLTFLDPLGLRSTFVTLYPAVILAALYGGLQAGLLATFLSALLATYYWMEPIGRFAIANATDALALGIFCLSSTLILWVTEAKARTTALRQEVAGRKRAEEASRRSQERLEWVLERTGVGTWFNELPLGALNWDEQTRRLFFVPPTLAPTAELFWSRLHPADREPTRQAVESAIRNHNRYEIEHRAVNPATGEVRWILSAGQAKYSPDGTPAHFDGINFDITPRKKAEEALREREARYRAIGESIDYGVWVCAPDGRNIYASESFLKLVGLTQEQCSNFGWGEVLHPDDAARTIAAWKECVQNGTFWDMEHRFRGVDGRWHPLLARGVPIRDEQGQITGWAGINLDISRLKEAEDRVKQSLKEKEVLLKEIHHRVKNNLQVISSLLSLQADNLDDAGLRGLFNDARDRVRSMALVHEKLYESESLVRVDFAEYSRGLLNYLWRAHMSSKQRIGLRLDLQPVWLSVETAVPCGLILNELAMNALKHAFAGRPEGEVTVALSRDAQGRVRLSVSDDGVGLPEGMDWRESGFLGLRLVQMLSGQLQGTVEASSSRTGTTFAISLIQVEPFQDGGAAHG